MKNIFDKYDMIRNVDFFLFCNDSHFARNNSQKKYMVQTWVQSYRKCKAEVMDNIDNQIIRVWKD